MTTEFTRGCGLALVLACWLGPAAAGQPEPAEPAEPQAPQDGWRIRPSLFLLGAYEHERGLGELQAGETGRGTQAPASEFQPALAAGLEATSGGARGSFDASASLLARDPFGGDTRALLFDGRVHAFRALGSRFRLELDELLRLERREAQPRGDFQRQQARATLEYRGSAGPAVRLRLADRRLGLPNAGALDVVQRSLELSFVASPEPGVSLAGGALLRRFLKPASRRNHVGAAFEATRLWSRGVAALHYHFTFAASAASATAAELPAPEAPDVFLRTAAADFSPQAAPQPLLASSQEPLDELPVVPLPDALDDEGESWPSRHEQVLSLYGSRRFGQRLRVVLYGQVRWRDGREPVAAALPGFDERRAYARLSARYALARHAALLVQAAFAFERGGNPALPELRRSQVFFGLQLY